MPSNSPASSYATEETFVLSRLPCWEHLSPEEYRRRVAELVEEIEIDARVARMERGFPVLGVGAVLRQKPHTRPDKTKKSPAPRFHAASKAIRNGLREAYGLFLAAFRDAAELLKAGDRSARFPVGFPPGLPFVRALAVGEAAGLDPQLPPNRRPTRTCPGEVCLPEPISDPPEVFSRAERRPESRISPGFSKTTCVVGLVI
jgi:hypothetical protein